MDESRRSAPRVSYMKEVRVEHAGMTTTFTALDLSTGGIGLWGSDECPSSCSLALPLEDDEEEVVLRGEVARRFQSDGGSVWGIRFVDVQPAVERRLAALVSRLLA